jgi:ATP-dependent Clp protease ATP-binding subunit ClpA
VIFFARYMASQAGSPEIDTEHMLLGLLVADQRLARRFLRSPWAAEEVWKEIEQSKPMPEPISVDQNLPLSDANKRALAYTAEEAERLFHKHIGSEHLLLGLLREKESFAAGILRQHGLDLASIRKQLSRTPHKDWPVEEFVRERGPYPADIVELRARVDAIRSRVQEAVNESDFAKARAYSEEERKERDKLRLLYRQHRLSDWIWG